MRNNKISGLVVGGLMTAAVFGATFFGGGISSAAEKTEPAAGKSMMKAGEMNTEMKQHPEMAKQCCEMIKKPEMQKMMQSSDMAEQCGEMIKNTDMQKMMPEMMKQKKMQTAMKQMMSNDPAFKQMMSDLIDASGKTKTLATAEAPSEHEHNGQHTV